VDGGIPAFAFPFHGSDERAFSPHENGKTEPIRPLTLVKLLKVLDRHLDLLVEVRVA